MGKWYEYNFSGKRILLVEDNQINTFMEQRLLEEVGFAVETAENGKQGVEKFEASGDGYFNAILMDVNMPVMDGWTATEVIRRLEKADATTIPIFAITTCDFDEDICRSKAVGMNEHLVKPLNPELLCKSLAQYIGESKSKIG